MKFLSILFILIYMFLIACIKDDKKISSLDKSDKIIITAEDLESFEEWLEAKRKSLNIPGCSASITNGGEIIWAEGFGFANREKEILATPTTSYRIASLTKTFASTIIMQLVEKNILNLDDPVSKYGININSSGTIRVRHLLTHTSEGNPGSYYKYDGSRFSYLGSVIAGASNKTFCNLLAENIIEPLNLKHTAPCLEIQNNCVLSGSEIDDFSQNLAQGYSSNGNQQEDYPVHFSPSAGLISSVIDMANYSIFNFFILYIKTCLGIFSNLAALV